VIAMKKAVMFLAVSLALSAPVGGVALTLIAGAAAIMAIHPEQHALKLRHFLPLSAQPAEGIKGPA
jgi:hypothetical protein